MEKVFIILLLLTPFAGFFANLTCGEKWLKKSAGYIGSFAALLSFGWAVCLFVLAYNGSQAELNLFNWMEFGGISINLDFALDRISLIWILFVTGIGFLIHLYSISYMSHDKNKPLFFAYLNLFIFFMLILVSGANLLVTFVGWEGVGLCSYLLIGFWTENHENNDAAKKAFVMNRIGDLGFIIALVTIVYHCGTLTYSELNNPLLLSSLSNGMLCLITIGFLIGALSKSAQLPLATWLPDAMAGPTPVSALIHAATMVTAGIYLIVKLNFIYVLLPGVLIAIAIIGCATSLFGAIIALRQNDIKKVLAYSTVSQLGMIFMALGMGAFHVAVFHVITHAFFKACLFLGAGSVIHALDGVQDIRKMGGLKSKMKISFISFTIASLSIAGIPFTAGFFSKDEIMISLFENYTVFWALGLFISLLTSLYIFRLLFLIFFGKFRGSAKQWNHIHESPKPITVPLLILAFFSIASGYIGWPSAHNWINTYLTPVLPQLADLHHVWNAETFILMIISSLIAFAGLLIAYFKYMKKTELPVIDTNSYRGFEKIAYKKFYLDEIYDFIIMKPLWVLATICASFFELFIKSIINFSGRLVMWLSNPLSKLQNGSVSFYLFFFVLGFGAITTFVFFIV